MSLSHSYIVVVIGLSVTLSFGFIFYYHSYIFSLTFILFCFSSFFFFLLVPLTVLCLHLCPPVVLFIWDLVQCQSLCVSALGSCLFLLPQVTLVARVRLFLLCDCSACFQLCEITFTASVSHSPSALIVTNTVYGPSCALQKEVLVIHHWLLSLFLLMLGFFTGF